MRHELLKNITRIVVKLGTGVITDSQKHPDPVQMGQLVAQVAAQRQAGREIVLVTSGAVGAGMGVLEMSKRPTDLAELQTCAAIGQCRLMALYEQLFAQFNLHVAQVLLTHDDWNTMIAISTPATPCCRFSSMAWFPSSTKTTPSPALN
jgi:glutamate 5-kinase